MLMKVTLIKRIIATLMIHILENKTQIMTNSLTNYITKASIINNVNALGIKKTFLPRIILQMCLEVTMTTLRIMCKKYDNRTFNNTGNITKHINQYTTDVVDTYKLNNVSNPKSRIIVLLVMLLLINVIPLTLMIHTI